MDCEQLQGFDGAAANRAQVFRFALSLTQVGDQADTVEVLKGFGGAGVLEVWRTMLAARIGPSTR